VHVSLIGTVDTIPLNDLFEVLAGTGKTGALHVRSEQGLGIVYFDGGKVCAGEAGHRSGPVDDRPALVHRLFDVCFELFRFEEAAFEFEVGVQPTWPAIDTVEVPEILAETARRLAKWAEIRATVPSLDARPRLVLEAPEGGVILESNQWRLVAAIDGRRKINALIRVLDSSDFEVCGLLAGLIEAGLVALDAPDPLARSDAEDQAEPAFERRWAQPRPSRLAAVLDEEPWDSNEDGPDVDMWDDQVMAATGTGLRQAARETARESAPAPVNTFDDDEDDDANEDGTEDGTADGFSEAPRAEEPEAVAAS
jgi:hypothetical protein